MERTINRITLVGFVGRDPQEDGGEVNFSVATERGEEGNDWHFVRAAADAVEGVKTGLRVFIEGSVEYHTREWEGGIQVPHTEVVAHRIVVLGG